MVDIHIDGAATGNPGLSGAGIVINGHGKITEYSIPLGLKSSHEAEFLAVIRALQICEVEFPGEILAIQSDSQIVVDAIEKNYVKNPIFQPLLEEIMQRADNFSYFFIKWIPRQQNKHADRLAKEAIQKQM